MLSYVVKHIVAEQGPISTVMKDVRKTPYSFTSKEPEAVAAAKGGDVYVIEVRNANGGGRIYSLGYQYKARQKFSLPGRLWKNQFEFKNSATPGEPAEGVYFDTPVIIEDSALLSWLSSKQPGMAEVPTILVESLKRIIFEPNNGAKRFA